MAARSSLDAPRRPPDLVCAGNLVVDDIVLPDGHTRMAQPGGAVLYAALGAALFGARVAILAPVGEDYPRDALAALERRGIDLSRLRPLDGPGLRAWLLYEPTARRILPRLGSPSHADASPTPADLSALAGARAFHLTPAPLASQQALLEALARAAPIRDGGGDGKAARAPLVSIDPHEPVTPDTLERWRAALALADIFFLNVEEIDLGRDVTEPRAAMQRFAGGRLRHLLWKQGSRGGVHCDLATGATFPWVPRIEKVVDPTGAGDAFAGGFLGSYLLSGDVGQALASGVVAASFALESWGPESLFAATPEAARMRLARWHR